MVSVSGGRVGSQVRLDPDARTVSMYAFASESVYDDGLVWAKGWKLSVSLSLSYSIVYTESGLL